MRTGGEACTSANRFFVHESVGNDFADRLAQRMEWLKVGRGTDDSVQVGPLIDDQQRGEVAELVQDALGRGARALCGGVPLASPGCFYAPTVLTSVPGDARLL
jgi:succinate-semialdehyde dehydrogenase/glutarate-semialdehyde dehydrogenase